MTRSWTFGRKIAAGFGAVLALSMLISAIAAYALKVVVADKDRVIEVNAKRLIDAEVLRTLTERKGNASRGFVLTRDERFLEQLQTVRADFEAAVARMRAV